jgi:hypothetical protein
MSTLFIPDSRRLRLSLSVIGLVAAIYLVVTLSLQALARTAETTGRVYPYKREEWLLYLLPTLWPHGGKPLLLLTGASTTREDFLVEDFTSAFPEYRVFQGGFSLGTLGDVLAALEYVEREHGARALPAILVLGVSPRFLAEIPADRPFAQGLARYSARYRVPARTAAEFGLEPKPALSGLIDHASFLLQKQGPRYQTAAAWLIGTLAGTDFGIRLTQSAPVRFILRAGRRARVLPPRAAELGIRDYALELVSPYRYHAETPYTVQELMTALNNPNSWWQDVHRWEPAADAGVIRGRGAALLAFTRRHKIELYLVNLPEHRLSRLGYRPGPLERYHSLLRSTFGEVPLLDLRCFLDDTEFYDAEHAVLSGARRVTARVIGFVKEARAGRASTTGSPLSPAARIAAVRQCEPVSQPDVAPQ